MSQSASSKDTYVNGYFDGTFIKVSMSTIELDRLYDLARILWQCSCRAYPGWREGRRPTLARGWAARRGAEAAG